MRRPLRAVLSHTFTQSARDGRLCRSVTRNTPTPVMCVKAWPATQGRRSFFSSTEIYFPGAKRFAPYFPSEKALGRKRACGGTAGDRQVAIEGAVRPT